MSIVTRDVSVKIGERTIIEGVNLELAEGKVVALLGLNGAGKTTLIKTITGLITPSSGSILIDGEKINELGGRERAKRMTYVPQQMENAFDYITKEFVLMGITPHLGFFETPRKKHKQQVVEALESLQIAHLGDKRLSVLSGGEKQIIYLARAMVQQAKVMILDEPTAYLDFKRQHLFLRDLTAFVKKSGKTTLFSVHDPNLALKYADQIVIVHNRTVSKILTKDATGWGESLQSTLEELYGEQIKIIDGQQQEFITYI